VGCGESASTQAIHPNEIRIAELADCPRAIDFASRPEIAPGEAAEHCCAPRVPAFALKGVEDLFHCVSHGSGRFDRWRQYPFQLLCRVNNELADFGG
jgi:hypothetical protein